MVTPDQTAQMSRLVRTYAGHTWNTASFRMTRLMLCNVRICVDVHVHAYLLFNAYVTKTVLLTLYLIAELV